MTTIPIAEKLSQQCLFFDGGIGTEIYKHDIFVNQCFDELNLTRPTIIQSIYQNYIDAGVNVITTNTYGANRIELTQFGLADKVKAINQAGIKLAQELRQKASRHFYIAASIGPGITGGLHEHFMEALQEQIQALCEAGADLIIFETQPNRTAVENCCKAMQLAQVQCPFVVSVKSSGMLVETELNEFKRMLAPLPQDLPQPIAWGLNCGNGPDIMLTLVQKVIKDVALPLIVQPNAGESKNVNGRQLFLSSPEYFTTYARRYMELGARGIGGCCGISPAHIADMIRSLAPLQHSVMQTKILSETQTITIHKEESPLAERSALGKKLAEKQWIQTIEIVPPTSYDLTAIIEKARICADFGIDCVNIPDGPRASARISPFFTALEIQKQANIEATIHVCARDRNLIGIQADLLACAGAGIHNILFVTGDPPKLGKYPFASGVFDVDSIGMTKLQKQLNQGVDLANQEINPQTHAVIGVGADPNALDLEREIRRLRQKVEAGAQFVTTQPIFDETVLLRFIEQIADLQIPIIAGIWPLASYRNALFMKNEVPGVSVPDEILRRMGAVEQREDQRKVGIEIARQAVERLRDSISGVQVSAPFGNIHTALAVLR